MRKLIIDSALVSVLATTGVLVSISSSTSVSFACFTGNGSHRVQSAAEKLAARKYWLKNSKKGRSLAQAPSTLPWGGDQKSWSSEAILANAITQALNEGWSMPGAEDVLVAVPVKMLPGKVPNPADTPHFVVNRPYGDGQTNAHVTFGNSWNEKEPELVVSLVQFKSGSPLIRFRFHFDQPQTATSIEMNYQSKAGTLLESLSNGVQIPNGDLQFDWRPSADKMPIWGTLFENKVAFVHFTQSPTWFPIDFRNVLMANRDLLASVPDSMKNYGKGLLDPEQVSVQGKNTNAVPFDVMNSATFASDLKAERFFPVNPPGIHSGYYDDNGNRIDTAVGNGATTLLDSVQNGGTAPFKMAYICFDKRDPGAEAELHVPSGGGWHEIGDPAETVINSLENASVIFGYANGVPAANPPSGSFDHGLTDVAVIRRLAPGSAIVTSAGVTSAQEELANRKNGTNIRGSGTSAGRNYHWFIFDQTHEVCAVEWVHKCVPNSTNQLGMNCSSN